MHIIMVSACEKRALKKTRAILDGYAMRTGESSWASPMTMEGLREVRAALKRVATRQTAVACYRNIGRSRMKLLWVVGSKAKFGDQGAFPVGTTTKKTVPWVAEWVRICALLAQAAGYVHDIGKASVWFQEKLKSSQAVTDPIRHEWLSMRLLQERRRGKNWETAWAAAVDNFKPDFFTTGIANWQDALDFLVVSHHGLLGPDKLSASCDQSNHIREKLAQQRELLVPAAHLPDTIFATYDKLCQRIATLDANKSPTYWRALSILARVALIFADHTISAVINDTGKHSNLLANTDPTTRNPNQALAWHLEQVGRCAGDTVYKMASLQLPGISEEAVETILYPSAENGRFAWQNQAVSALTQLRANSTAPVLVFNMASTGSGKTRMNAKTACALGKPGFIRFANVLNLKTLTLQTSRAFNKQLGIGLDEMATIIGDKVALELDKLDKQGSFLIDDDENLPQTEFTADGLDNMTIPDWLLPLVDKKPGLRRIIGAPVLVATIDFLIAAGEPQQQGHHVGALLRLMDSDIVLDEVDSYDPHALVAVLRMVQMAAFFGRNVICSSATLTSVVASAIHKAFSSGVELRANLLGNQAMFSCAILADLVQPEILSSHDNFETKYQQYIGLLRQKITKSRQHLCKLILIPERSQQAWKQAVLQSVQEYHQLHAWDFLDTGKKVSFGLVRVANIKTAICLARMLATKLPSAKVACYHSQDFVMQRFLKEQRLDHLLNRKNGNTHIEDDPEIQKIVAAAKIDTISFIVVATPVEEIGRDHDFDWAVIEPSSMHSIIQTMGRVNRHRLQPVSYPNIGLLDYNYRLATAESLGIRQTYFLNPGFEISETVKDYRTHRLQDLLEGWNNEDILDGYLRFADHPFAIADNNSIGKVIETPLKILFDTNKNHPAIMSQGLYKRYQLRSNIKKQYWRRHNDDFERWILTNIGNKKISNYLSRNSDVEEEYTRLANDWLTWEISELLEFCEQWGIDKREGLAFEVNQYNDNHKISWDHSFGFQRLS